MVMYLCILGTCAAVYFIHFFIFHVHKSFAPIFAVNLYYYYYYYETANSDDMAGIIIIKEYT